MVRIFLRVFSALALLFACSVVAGARPHDQPGSSADPQTGYTLILVEASSSGEIADARDFIASQGGEIAIVIPPHAILGWIPPATDSRILGRHGIRSIHRSTLASAPSGFTDRETQTAINAFNDVVSGRRGKRRQRESEQPAGPEAGRPGMIDCAPPHPSINKNEVIRNLRLMGAENSVLGIQSTVTPQYFGNSDVMDGSIDVEVFLVESNGGIDPNSFSWSQADQDSAQLQVLDGLNWWVEQSRAFHLARPLNFTLHFHPATEPVCQVPYEPILHPGSDAYLWINQVMANVGSSSGTVFERVAAFDLAMRDRNHTNWAYSMFIAYNPPSPSSFTDGRASWAYIGGPYTVSLYHSFGWTLSKIATHETGHIFYACDEYFQPGYQVCSCTCAPEVRPNALNGNCQDLACTRSSTACMMRINELALCPFTVAQIGWTQAVPKPPPTAPSGLVVSAASPTQVNLVWQDTSTVEDGFQIERRGGTSADFSQIGVVGAGLTGFTDTSVLANTAYAYRVRAFNSSGTSAYSNEASIITPETPSLLSIATASLSEATVGVPYSRTLSATGGKPDFSWLLDSGSLPPGLSLSQTGSVAGTPTSAGTFNFVAKVIDSTGASATKALTLVSKPSAPLSITATQLPRGSVGTTYSQNLGASGGQTPYTWSIQSGSLPDGLTLNQGGGSISGTPERAGTSSFTIKLSDAVGASVTETLSITINPATAVLAIDTLSLPDGVVGDPYSQTLKGSGGNPPYLWDLKSGKLPDGLQLSDAGVISGTPTTAGEVAFEVRATDQSGQSIARSLSIDINPPPQLTILTPSALPVAAVGVPYHYELKASAGTPPYFWVKKKKAKFGTLPDGITISSDGVISGTPTTQGTSNFTVIVTDAEDRQAAKPLTLEVGPPPPPLSIRTDTLPQALQNVPYATALEASGGVGPYSWSIDTGVLPAGLTMSADGVISGRPTTAGGTSFVVRVKDALGTSATKTFALIVAQPPPPLVIQTVSLPDTTAERPYSQTLQATGGVPPYTWSIASGSLGAGLNLSAGGTISGTPVSPGTSVFVVRVTDSAGVSATRTLAIVIKPADKLAPFGVLETPGSRATLNGVASGSGWALDNVGVVQIDVLIDGQKIGDAIYGLSRPDIAIAWPSFPNAAQSGFSFQFDTSKFNNGEHTMAVRLMDAAGNTTVVGTRTIIFQNQVLVVSTTDLVKGKKGDPYSMQLSAANGKPPYTWTLVSGSLAPGLSLNAAGIISGTPTGYGTYSFTVRVTDSVGGTALASFTLIIIPDIEPLRILSSGDLDRASTGVPYSVQLFFTGGVPPRAWGFMSGTLPPGLSFSSTGLISGVPTQVGVFAFTVKLTDSAPTTVVSQPLIITVVPGPPHVLTTGDLTNGTVAVAYSQSLQGAYGVLPYSWALASGALPLGLSLSANTGAISGTPTQYGTFSFTVQLTDSQPISAVSGTLRITIDPAPLAITTTGNLTGGKVSVSYSYQLQATGGRTPYTWALASGTGPMPPGLTLNATTGVISGKPTTVGVYSFSITVADATAPTPNTATSSTLTIAIDPAPLTVTTSGDLTGGKVNTDYSYQLQATGGKTPYIWALASGSGPLPAGLTLNAATGVISGKPTAAGTFTFSVAVTDATPNTATSSALKIVVSP